MSLIVLQAALFTLLMRTRFCGMPAAARKPKGLSCTETHINNIKLDNPLKLTIPANIHNQIHTSVLNSALFILAKFTEIWDGHCNFNLHVD